MVVFDLTAFYFAVLEVKCLVYVVAPVIVGQEWVGSSFGLEDVLFIDIFDLQLRGGF